MGEDTIGIKKLHKELSAVTEAVRRGKSFIVVKHAQPVFRIEPINPKQKKYGLHDFANIRLRSPDRNLSKKIDKIVYGL